MTSVKMPSISTATSIVKSSAHCTYPGGRSVLVPVVRASTVLFESLQHMESARQRRDTHKVFTYGSKGNPTNFSLEDLIAELEGGFRTRLFPTGLAAIAMVFTAYFHPGDHILISDAVYQPVRCLVSNFCEKFGIRVTFFQPTGEDLERKIEARSRGIYVESPGSIFYEMCDLPEIAAIARKHALLVIADNTWGSAIRYSPLRLGADVSIVAATKYLSGHADVMMGAVTTTEDAWSTLFRMCETFGMTVSPDDSYLVLRGIRTLAARMDVHERGALVVAQWLARHGNVAHVFCPALPGHPQHNLWRRDCRGTNGLLTIQLRDLNDDQVRIFIDSLNLFGIGASWGGFESLITPCNMVEARSLTDWSGHTHVLRLHIGLEDPNDLVSDLRQAFEISGGITDRRT